MSNFANMKRAELIEMLHNIEDNFSLIPNDAHAVPRGTLDTSSDAYKWKHSPLNNPGSHLRAWRKEMGYPEFDKSRGPKKYRRSK